MILKPYLDKQKFQRTVNKIMKERIEELSHFKERGFESKDAYRVFLDRRDRATAAIQSSKRKVAISLNNLEKTKDTEQMEKMKKEVEQAMKNYKSVVDFQIHALSMVTPEDYKPKQSKKKLAITAIVAAAAGAGGIFAATKFLGKEGGNGKGPSTKTDVFTVPTEVNTDIVKSPETVQIEVSEEKTETMKNIISSNEYKEQAQDIVTSTQAKINEVTQTLNETYSEINSFCEISGVDEGIVIGRNPGDRLGSVSNYERQDGESLVSFCIRGKEQAQTDYDILTSQYIQEFKKYFPETCQLYEKYGIDLDYVYVSGQKSIITDFGVDNEEYNIAKYHDEAKSNISLRDFRNSHDKLEISNDQYCIKSFNEYLDNYMDSVDANQQENLQNLVDTANGCYNSYDTILSNYSNQISDLQSSMLDGNLVQTVNDILTTAGASLKLDSQSISVDHSDILDKISSIVDSAVNEATDVAEKTIEQIFGM